ncbi:MAG: O-antigen ligase family protein [Candidatus Paceibacterota bacterium]
MEKIVFYFLIFAVPFQVRFIWGRWVQPFNEWTAGFIYGTDILVILLFLLWLLRSHPKLSLRFKAGDPSLWLFLFFAISALSIIKSGILPLSFYILLKLAEFIGFYFYLNHNLGSTFQFKRVVSVVVASGFFQAVIGVLQYATQSSLGFKILGESFLTTETPGAAVFVVDSVKYLRVYGTTPHPNVLAAWLFLALFAFYFWYFYYNRKGLNAKSMGVYGVILVAFFFTFSRVIIGLWLLGVLIRLLILFLKNDFRGILHKVKRKLIFISVITVIISGAFVISFWPQVQSRIHVSLDEQAVTHRVFYNNVAGETAIESPLLGVGIGQFVPHMMSKLKYLPAYVYQPVHNIYLLVASETGFIGLAAFGAFLFTLFRKFFRHPRFGKLHHYSFFILAASFLVMGIFDHFLWTLQQGSLVFWLMMSLINLGPDIRGVDSQI